jgi:hypothetical protein
MELLIVLYTNCNELLWYNYSCMIDVVFGGEEVSAREI